MAKDITIKQQQRFDYNKYLKGTEVPHGAVNIKGSIGIISSNIMPGSGGTRSAMDYSQSNRNGKKKIQSSLASYNTQSLKPGKKSK